MLRLSPRARALLERARRPLTMFAIGAALAAPASAFIVREDAARAGLDGEAETSWSNDAATSASGSAINSAERADAEMTLGLSRLYSVPVGVAAQIQQAATTEGIAPRLAFGLVHTESEFKRTAVSHVGAIGYTQVMPGTARTLQPGTTRSDLFDGETNLHLGFKYLKGLIDRYDGNVRLALTAYNRGPGTVDHALQRGRDPENGYATKVLANPATLKLQQQRARSAAAPDAARAPAHASAHHARADATRHTHRRARHPAVRHHAIRRAHPPRKHRRRR